MAEALNLVKGSGIELTKNAANNTLTISAIGSTIHGMDYGTYAVINGTTTLPTTDAVNVIIYITGGQAGRGYSESYTYFWKTSQSTSSELDPKTGQTISVHRSTFTKVYGSAEYNTLVYTNTTDSWVLS